MIAVTSMRVRSLLINIGVSLLSLLVCVLFLEWFLRFANIQRLFPLNPPIFRMSDDPAISYELIPSVSRTAYANTVTVNASGFRSPPVDSSKPLVAMIGDSVTFGQGVGDSQTIGAYLQTLLPEHAVLNAGVGGYNIEQELAQYRRHIKAMQPAAVILTFVYNDFDGTMALDEEGYLYPRGRRQQGTFMERLRESVYKPGTLPIPFKLFLQTHSAVFTLLERSTKGMAFRSHAPAGSIFADAVTDEQLEWYRERLHLLTQETGDAAKLFVIWPEENLHLRSRAILKTMAAQEGFAVLDLYEVYGNTYGSLGWDGHPNAATNRRTAAIIADALKEFGMLGK